MRHCTVIQTICKSSAADGQLLLTCLNMQTHLCNASGNPTDPVTTEWLVKNYDPIFGFSDIVRFSWQVEPSICLTNFNSSWHYADLALIVSLSLHGWHTQTAQRLLDDKAVKISWLVSCASPDQGNKLVKQQAMHA